MTFCLLTLNTCGAGFEGEKRFARWGSRWSPQEEGGGGGALEKGLKRQSPCVKTVHSLEDGEEIGPGRKCSEISFPHDTSLKMISAFWGSFEVVYVGVPLF